MTLPVSRSEILAGTAFLALAPRPLRAQSLTRVRLAGVHTDDLTPVYWGIQNGMYQKAGLDIEMVPANSGTAATTAVVARTYQLGKGSNIAAPAAHLRGLPITIIANGVLWDANAPVSVQVVFSDSPYQSAKDLNGKIGAATGLNDIVVLTMSDWIDKNGGDSKRVKWVEIMLNEPYYTAAAATGKVRRLNPGFSMSAIGEHYVVAIYFAHRDFASKKFAARSQLSPRHLRGRCLHQCAPRGQRADDGRRSEDSGRDDPQDVPPAGLHERRSRLAAAGHRRGREVRQHSAHLRGPRRLLRVA